VLSWAVNAQAFMTGRVDGHKVYYSAEQAYMVDASFEYIGSYTTNLNIQASDVLKQVAKIYQTEVFGKRHNGTNELDTLFIARWEKLPDGWRWHNPGPLKESLYEFKVPRFTGLEEFLREKGFTFTDKFYGGILLGTIWRETTTKYFFCVSQGSIPQNVDKAEFVRSAFRASIVPAQ
jgi:hypothetical protein